MKNIKIITLFLLSIFFGQQDILAQGGGKALAPLKGRLTQYMLHQPFINPAAMGSYETFTAAAYYRNQWTGMEGTPNTQGINVTAPIGENNALGGSLIRDEIGNGYESRYDIYVDYAYKLKLTENDFLSFGISGGGQYVVNDYSGLGGIAPDPSLPAGVQSKFAPNMKLGAYYYRNRIYAGLAMANMFSTREDKTASSGYRTEYFNWDDVEYMGHAGISLPITDYWDLEMSTLGRYKVGSTVQADFNAQMLYDRILGMGVTYRTSNEMAIMANIRFLEHFRFGYAYEFFINGLQSSNSGTHEVMLIYQLASPKGSAIIIPRF